MGFIRFLYRVLDEEVFTEAWTYQWPLKKMSLLPWVNINCLKNSVWQVNGSHFISGFGAGSFVDCKFTETWCTICTSINTILMSSYAEDGLKESRRSIRSAQYDRIDKKHCALPLVYRSACLCCQWVALSTNPCAVLHREGYSREVK